MDTSLVAHWPFNGDSELDTKASVALALTNATVAGGVLTLGTGTQAMGQASIGQAFSGSYQVGFNVMFSPGAVTTSQPFFSIGTGINLNLLTNRGVQAESALSTVDSAPAVITDGQKYRILSSANVGVTTPSHVGGYFQTLYGGTDRAVSYYYADPGLDTASQYDLLFTGSVKPVDSSFLSATGGAPTNIAASLAAPVNMCELMAVGDTVTSNPGQELYVGVWVWQGGRVLLVTNTAYNASLVPLVGAREFVLGLHLHPTAGPQLYINGVLKSSSFAGWKNISDNSTLASPPQEINPLSPDGLQSGTLKIVQKDGKTTLQAITPEGQDGGSIVLSADSALLQSGTKKLGVQANSVIGGGTGSSIDGIKAEAVDRSDPVLAGLDTYIYNAIFGSPFYVTPTPADLFYSVLSSTKHDLVLAGNNVVNPAPGSAPRSVVTLGELHAYKGDGSSVAGGDAIKVYGKHLNTSTGLQDPACLTLGVHQAGGYQVGSSTTRALVASTSNADLFVESGDQLRLRGRAGGVVLDSLSSIKLFPKADLVTDNQRGWLEVGHKDDNPDAAITLSTPSPPQVASPIDIVVKPGAGKVGLEADVVELGSGDIRYKLAVVNGQLRIIKRVISAAMEKTVFIFDS
eukprot:jgi/Mesvir1/24132/Mv10849-RA.1